MKERPESKAQPDKSIVETAEIIEEEKIDWKHILGAEVEVKPLPEYVTPQVRENLKNMELGLRYMPELELGTLENLRGLGVQRYLRGLEERYPKWRRFESLSKEEQLDYRVSRNLSEFYWKSVEKGSVDFPVLSGQWMAVETVEKPSYGSKYPRTPMAEKLGFSEDRFNVSWIDAYDVMKSERKTKILSEAGLTAVSGADLRFLEAAEWNLLGNREGWGKTDTFEWTNTEYRHYRGWLRLIIGQSRLGGSANVRSDYPFSPRGSVGFRVAIILGS